MRPEVKEILDKLNEIKEEALLKLEQAQTTQPLDNTAQIP